MRAVKTLGLAYLLVLHLLVVLMLVKSDFIEKVGYRLGLFITPEFSAYYEMLTTHHSQMDSSIPDGATIFIGDSLTQGLATAAVATLSVNYGIGFDTTLGVLKRIPTYASLTRAEAVVLAVGLNDLRRRSDEQLIANYKAILDVLPETLPVVVSAILPVDERVATVDRENARIARVNEMIRALAGAYANVTFWDAGDLLRGPDNNLQSGFHVGDGVHLSGAGYQVWIKELRRALAAAQQQSQMRDARCEMRDARCEMRVASSE